MLALGLLAYQNGPSRRSHEGGFGEKAFMDDGQRFITVG